MIVKNISLFVVLLLFETGCYSVANTKIRVEPPRLSTNLKKQTIFSKYKKVGLNLDEIGLGGYVNEVFLLRDTLHFVGEVVDGAHNPASNVKLHPCQLITNPSSGKVNYRVIRKLVAVTDSNGRFELKVPIEVQVDGIVRYQSYFPPKRISAWLYMDETLYRDK
jgi:hypothetical protein